MTSTAEDLFDFLTALENQGAYPGGQAVLISSTKRTLQWNDSHLLQVHRDAEANGLIEAGRGMYAVPTLAGERVLRAGRPQPSATPSSGADPLTDADELERRLQAMDDNEFAAVERAVGAERARRDA